MPSFENGYAMVEASKTNASQGSSQDNKEYRFSLAKVVYYLLNYVTISWTPYYYRDYACHDNVSLIENESKKVPMLLVLIARGPKLRSIFHMGQLMYLATILLQVTSNGVLDAIVLSATGSIASSTKTNNDITTDRPICLVYQLIASVKEGQFWNSAKLLLFYNIFADFPSEAHKANVVTSLLIIANLVQKTNNLLRRQKIILRRAPPISLIGTGSQDSTMDFEWCNDTHTIDSYSFFVARPQLTLKEWYQYLFRSGRNLDDHLLKIYPNLIMKNDLEQMLKFNLMAIIKEKNPKMICDGVTYHRIAISCAITILVVPLTSIFTSFGYLYLVALHNQSISITSIQSTTIEKASEVMSFFWLAGLAFSNFSFMFDVFHLGECCSVLISRSQIYSAQLENFITKCRLYRESDCLITTHNDRSKPWWFKLSSIRQQREQLQQQNSLGLYAGSSKSLRESTEYENIQDRKMMSKSRVKLCEECDTMLQILHQLLNEFNDLKNFFSFRTSTGLIMSCLAITFIISCVIEITNSAQDNFTRYVCALIYYCVITFLFGHIILLLMFPIIINNGVSISLMQ